MKICAGAIKCFETRDLQHQGSFELKILVNYKYKLMNFNGERSSSGPVAEDPRKEPVFRRIPIDTTQIQVLASKAELDRRIAAFIAAKREEINRLNNIDFCRRFEEVPDGESCARVDAILVKKEGSRSHLRTASVPKITGPQVTCRNVEDAFVMACPSYPEPLHNRLQDMEARVFKADCSLPRDLYARMKQLEDRILFLEGTSPEYANAMGILVSKAEDRDRTRREQARRSQLSASLRDLDEQIEILEAKLRQKYSSQ